VKHGVTELTTTFLRLKAEKFVPKRDLIIYFSGDEETAMDTTVAVVNKHRELIDAEYALNSDGGGGTLDDETGKPLFFGFQTAEKTYADFKLTARNPGGHSSLPRPDNAIYDLSEALVKLRKFSFPVMWNDTTIASFRESARTTPGELGQAMAKFAANPKDETASAALSANPSYVGQVRTTCVATMLEGGHAQNALPQSAVANVNCRIFPGVKIEDVRAALAGVVGEGIEVKVDGEPMSSDASPLRKDVLAAVTRVVHKFYPGVIIVPQQASGATDGLVFRAVGIPTYGVDPTFIADKDAMAHGLNERLPGGVVLQRPRDVVPAHQGSRRQEAVNEASEPLGTTRFALANGERLLGVNPEAAAEQANEILKIIPDHAQALTLLGLAQGRLGKGEEAIESLRRAVHFDPAQPDAWRALGDHYSALEMRDAADNAFAQQIRYSTKDPKLMTPALALSENRIPEAEALLREHLRHYPTDVAAIRMLAEVAARIGRIADSEVLLARCLELAPGFAIARQNYAMMLHRANKPEAAMRETNTLLADDPTNPGLRNLKARILGRHRGVREVDRASTRRAHGLSRAAAHLDEPRPRAEDRGENAASIDAYPALHRADAAVRRGVVESRQPEDVPLQQRGHRDDARAARAHGSHERRPLSLRFRARQGAEDAGEYAESFAAVCARQRAASQAHPLRRGRQRSARRAIEKALHGGVPGGAPRRGLPRARSHFRRRPAACRLHADRADPRDTLAGRGHAGAARRHHDRAHHRSADHARRRHRLSASARQVFRRGARARSVSNTFRRRASSARPTARSSSTRCLTTSHTSGSST
jgi:acetylornithine deacetylase/succinyl-diaminopimelate desuccinylase-like protein/Flp pilus assembly protein TadD